MQRSSAFTSRTKPALIFDVDSVHILYPAELSDWRTGNWKASRSGQQSEVSQAWSNGLNSEPAEKRVLFSFRQEDNCRMFGLSRIPKIDVVAVASMLIGAGLSIVAGKTFGWLMVGLGIGILIVVHAPASWTGRSVPQPIAVGKTDPAPEQTRAKPTIKRLNKFGTKTAFVSVPYDTPYFMETTNNEKKALMAVFENAIHGTQTVGYIGDVSGRIRFKGEDGKEITDLRVQQGCWLQASSHEVHFPANAQHSLIVAIKGYYGTQIVREAYKHFSGLKKYKV